MARVIWVLLSVIWGLTWLAVRIGLNDIPPFTFAGLRFITAAAVLFAVMVARGSSLPRAAGEWRLLVRTALLTIGLAYSLQFWGQQYVESGLTSVMFATVPLFTLVFAHQALPNEPLTQPKLVGVLLGIAGVGLVFADQLGGESVLAVWSCLAFLVGAASMALAQVQVKRDGRHIEPLVIAGFQMAIGGAILVVVGFALEGGIGRITWTLSATASLAYLALLGSALAFFLFYWLLRHMEVTKVMAMALVHPVVAVLAGWLLLGEKLGWRVLAGGATVLLGLGLMLGSRRSDVSARRRASG